MQVFLLRGDRHETKKKVLYMTCYGLVIIVKSLFFVLLCLYNLSYNFCDNCVVICSMPIENLNNYHKQQCFLTKTCVKC